MLPDHKADIMKQLRGQGRVVVMAGDRVNDARALAATDVGLAMSSGTDVAIKSAGVTLLKGDLTGIVRARKLSQATMSEIRQTSTRRSGSRSPLDRRRRHGTVLGQRHQQRTAPARPPPVDLKSLPHC